MLLWRSHIPYFVANVRKTTIMVAHGVGCCSCDQAARSRARVHHEESHIFVAAPHLNVQGLTCTFACERRSDHCLRIPGEARPNEALVSCAIQCEASL